MRAMLRWGGNGFNFVAEADADGAPDPWEGAARERREQQGLRSVSVPTTYDEQEFVADGCVPTAWTPLVRERRRALGLP